ncbi:2Fe-2S iron-sulfur cluster binding domain-containing protein [Variovorax robiniae]|uniref:2Fe-2S iron-sulfur cluster binding domain-containing protein n=1 Tax=Variovorax robiniae TaxID=1836199 RepID=A0ABU8X8X6_9BURK
MDSTTASSATRGAFTLSVDGVDCPVMVEAGETLLKAGLRQGLRIPHLCLVGDCGSCRCRLVSGQVQLKKDISNHIHLGDIASGHLLACQALAGSDVQLEVPGLSPMASDALAFRNLKGRIVSTDPMNHDIREVVVELEAPMQYRAGQYAQVTVPGHDGLADEPRCYSFSEAPVAGGSTRVTFHVRRVPGGLLTEWLFASDRTGHALDVSGPLGDFAHDGSATRPMVCVAGGSGLAPIKALIEELATQAQVPDLTLFFGARTQADLYCLEEIETLQTRWRGRFIFVPVLSLEPVSSGWSGLTGYCGEHLDKFCDLPSSSFYFCGPPPMVDALVHRLEGQADARHIHYDRFLDRSTLNLQETTA